MAESFDVLAQGTAPTTPGVIYTVPAATQAIFKNMRILNVASASATVSIGINGTADQNLIEKDTAMNVGQRGIDDTLTLGAGDTITMSSDKPSAIAYTIMGVKIT